MLQFMMLLGGNTTPPSSHAYTTISNWDKILKQIMHNLTTCLHPQMENNMSCS